MKITNPVIAALVFSLITSLNAHSETIHQTIQGENATSSNGSTALSQNIIEVNDVASADGGKVGRLKGSIKQWGFASYWFGIPAPAGNVTVRFKIYVDGTDTTTIGIYTNLKSGQNFVTKLQIPADAKKGSFVTVDVPISATEEWSGLTLKKFTSDDKPGPWIDSISTVLP